MGAVGRWTRRLFLQFNNYIMAGNEIITGRFQHTKYTAAALTAKNPLLLDGEVVYESDTGRSKIGDGVNKWSALPYQTDAAAVPAVTWKVQGGMLCVKPATDLKNPILKQCFVGILHYKNAKKRYRRNPQTGQIQNRPLNAGFKLVQDTFAREELAWTSVRINPVPFDATKVNAAGWMPIISIANLLERWVGRISDPVFVGGGEIRAASRHQYRRPRRKAGAFREAQDAGFILRRSCTLHRKCEIPNRGGTRLFQIDRA